MAQLHGIVAGVYLSLMGPQGMKELGECILYKATYAAKRLGQVKGVKTLFSTPHFKEFVVNFDGTGKTVKEINKALLDSSYTWRQGSFCRFSQSRAECALLRDRDSLQEGHRLLSRFHR